LLPVGSLAPEGSVAKITGKEGLAFTGKALCYDKEEDMLAALEVGSPHVLLPYMYMVIINQFMAVSRPALHSGGRSNTALK